jgi:hypothetical protein
MKINVLTCISGTFDHIFTAAEDRGTTGNHTTDHGGVGWIIESSARRDKRIYKTGTREQWIGESFRPRLVQDGLESP